MRMMAQAAMTMACCITGCTMLTGTEEVTLVRDGKPTAVIVVAEKPTRSVQFAAKELQNQIKAITGTTLAIMTKAEAGKKIIYVGESEAVKKAGLDNNQFKEQEYAIKFIPNGIILTGLDAPDYSKIVYDPEKPQFWRNLPSFWDERGTLNAVYDFLERFCGVRYFNSTEFGTDFPKKSTLTIKRKDVRRKPFFRYRDVYPAIILPQRIDNGNIMWKKNSNELALWREAAYPELKKNSLNPKLFKQAHRQLLYRYLLRSRAGGKKMATNHSLYPYYAYFWDKKSKNFIKSKPLFFAKGKSLAAPSQLCYTNNGLIDQVAIEAINYFRGKDITGQKKRNPCWGKNNFAIVPMDNSSYCHCKKCRKLLALSKEGENRKRNHSTNLMFNFVNKVAKKINKANPDKTVSTLAYAGYMNTPDFPLEDNIAVQFCWESNRSPEFTESYQMQENYLRKWAKKNPARGLYLWLYYTFPREYALNGNYHCFPAFFAHTIGKQFSLFHKLGIKGMFHCGYGQEVESYITFRLMNDPTLDVDDLLYEYFQRMYGPAAKPMQKIYETIENIYQNPQNNPKGVGGMEISWKYKGTLGRMAKLQALCDKAKKLAKASPYKERMILWDKGIWAYMKKGAAMYQQRIKYPMPQVKVPKITNINGNIDEVDWSKAVILDKWYNIGQGTPATRKLSGKFLHDDKYLYVELNDPCNTAKLITSTGVFAVDTWEIFISKQRGIPYRQYAFGPTGKMVTLSHGEVNFRKNVKIETPSVIRKSYQQKNLWRLIIAFPLKNALQTSIEPCDKLYLNVVRVGNKALSNVTNRFDMSTLVSYSNIHDPFRAVELTLEQ